MVRARRRLAVRRTRSSGILYVAKQLPPPGRDGLPPAYLDEIARPDRGGRRAHARAVLLDARGQAGRRGAARPARRPRCCARATTRRRSWSSSSPTTRRRACSARCRCGRASTCPARRCSWSSSTASRSRARTTRCVAARQRAVDARGGNGFMTVAATHAALLLAQGAGRLLRSMDDRGVVAILDPRLATARYGGFLRASLPPFWRPTTGRRSSAPCAASATPPRRPLAAVRRAQPRTPPSTDAQLAAQERATRRA